MPKRGAPSKSSPEPYVLGSHDGAGYGLCPVCANVMDDGWVDRVYLHWPEADVDASWLVCRDHSWRAIVARFPTAFARETPLL